MYQLSVFVGLAARVADPRSPMDGGAVSVIDA